jgi:hypothetical protein
MYTQSLHFHFYILIVTKFSSIDYSNFIPFYVYRNNYVLIFVVMEMLLLPQSAEAMFLFLMQASKPMTLVLRYFHMLIAFFLSNYGRHRCLRHFI